MSDKDEPGWPFDILGLAQKTTDKKLIKRAYARKLKKIDQSEQIKQFQDLRQAYQSALNWEDWQDWEENKDISFDPAPPENLPPGSSKALPVELQEVKNTTACEADEKEFTIEQLPKTNWSKVRELIDNLTGDQGEQNWQTTLEYTLNDPVFSDPQALQELEQEIFNYLSEQMIYGKNDQFHLPPHITYGATVLLDEKFGWLSDYVYLQKRFWNAETIMIAMTSLAAENQSSFRHSWKKNPVAWLFNTFITFRFVLFCIFIGVILNVVASQIGFSTDETFRDATIQTLAIIFVGVVNLKIIRILIEVFMAYYRPLFLIIAGLFVGYLLYFFVYRSGFFPEGSDSRTAVKILIMSSTVLFLETPRKLAKKLITSSLAFYRRFVDKSAEKS